MRTLKARAELSGPYRMYIQKPVITAKSDHSLSTRTARSYSVRLMSSDVSRNLKDQ